MCLVLPTKSALKHNFRVCFFAVNSLYHVLKMPIFDTICKTFIVIDKAVRNLSIYLALIFANLLVPFVPVIGRIWLAVNIVLFNSTEVLFS